MKSKVSRRVQGNLASWAGLQSAALSGLQALLPALCAVSFLNLNAAEPASAVPVVVPVVHGPRVHVPVHPAKKAHAGAKTAHFVLSKHGWKMVGPKGARRGFSLYSGRRGGRTAYANGRRSRKGKVVASKPIAPQSMLPKLSSETLAPGLVHKQYRGALTINVLDVDMMTKAVRVRPELAGESFNCLRDVSDHAKDNRAIAAVNANYFKKDGTPLGTLMIDKEWVAGPLYDRVSMGITPFGFVRIDRVNLHGVMETSNPDVPTIWVNNVNQPRRHGVHVVAYSRRWGSTVKLPYEASLVAVNAQGEVVDSIVGKTLAIPYGGYVFTDGKGKDISKLKRGDLVHIAWQTSPNSWDDVTQAVSGGPMLIRDGKLYLDLKDENFRRSWTGAQIHARTVCGVTAENHLILATVEGPHTLWDIAKFLQQLGCVDAMNLDGGGSTTMVVNGKTVTRNAKSSQRRVASTIAILDEKIAEQQERRSGSFYQPKGDLSEFYTPRPGGLVEPATGIGDLPDRNRETTPADVSAKPDSKPSAMGPAPQLGELFAGLVR